jgi:hypothetical protein
VALKVYKVADIVGNMIIWSNQRKFKPGDVAGVLTNLQSYSNPNPSFQWQLELEIGVGQSKRTIHLDLPPLINESDSLDSPLVIGEGKIIYFRNRLFMPDRIPRTTPEKEEIILRVKKSAYDEDADIANLRATIANLEAAVEYKKSGPRRDPIPEDVKLVVWTRDGRACVRCGSKHNLHFDHIIPLAKGGGNSEANIQILCQSCNLKKADKIAAI